MCVCVYSLYLLTGLWLQACIYLSIRNFPLLQPVCVCYLVAMGGADMAVCLQPSSYCIFIHAYVWDSTSAFLSPHRPDQQYLNGLMQRLHFSPKTYIRLLSPRNANSHYYCGFLDAQQVSLCVIRRAVLRLFYHVFALIVNS